MRYLTIVVFTLVLIGIAFPAEAALRCKARVDKRTGVIGYYFSSSTQGNVQWSYNNLGPPREHDESDSPHDFANSERCQASGKGKACVISDDPDLAGTLPSNCKIYLYSGADDSVCEVFIKDCQRAVRPHPADGFHAIENNLGSTACFDARHDREWHLSDQSDARGLVQTKAQLEVLNGVVLSDGNARSLHASGDLELPKLPELRELASACQGSVGIEDCFDPMGDHCDPCLASLCTEAWPAQDSCVWSASTDPASGQPWAITRQGGGADGSLIGFDIGPVGAASDCRSVFRYQVSHDVRFVDAAKVSDAYNHASQEIQ